MPRKFGHQGRVDRNQAEIVSALRKVGAFVRSTASLADGFPDLLVGHRGVWKVMEVKMPGETLTADEEIWWAKAKQEAGIEPCIVYSIEDAFREIGL